MYQVLAVAQTIALTMSTKCGLGVRASDLKDEQLANVKKVGGLRLQKTCEEHSAKICLIGSLRSQYSDIGRPHCGQSFSRASSGCNPATKASRDRELCFCRRSCSMVSKRQHCHNLSMPSSLDGIFRRAQRTDLCRQVRATIELGCSRHLDRCHCRCTCILHSARRADYTKKTSLDCGVVRTPPHVHKHNIWSSSCLHANFFIRTPACTIGAIIAYGKYWHQQPRDTTRDIVVPLLWSQGALHASIVTACIPSIKRFFMSAQSGLMGVQITEQYELTHDSRKGTRSTALSQNESRSEPRVGKGTTSNTEQPTGHDAHHPSPGVYTGSEEAQSRTRVRGGLPKEQAEETESMRGLTSDVIHERREFTLDFADEGSRHSSMK